MKNLMIENFFGLKAARCASTVPFSLLHWFFTSRPTIKKLFLAKVTKINFLLNFNLKFMDRLCVFGVDVCKLREKLT